MDLSYLVGCGGSPVSIMQMVRAVQGTTPGETLVTVFVTSFSLAVTHG
jgi:hypothetical protein